MSTASLVFIAYVVMPFERKVEVRPLEQPVSTPDVAYVIAMTKLSGHRVAQQIRAALKLREVVVVLGHNGTNVSLPLYTRHLIDHGRHEHMQIGNRPMVGCLMSHAHVWRMIRDWAYVFEEDAWVPDYGHALVSRLMLDLRGLPWSALMLQERSKLCTGPWSGVGEYAATCKDCTWFNTRGYVITRQGADILLRYVEPMVVQVDALIGLVNVYDPDFYMYWTRLEVAHGTPHHSFIQEDCLDCSNSKLLVVLAGSAACALFFYLRKRTEKKVVM